MLDTAPAQQDALAQFDQDVLATTTRRSEDAKTRTLQNMCRQWGLDLLPLTRAKMRIVGASLKAGGYRSASQYLYLAKKLHERDDHAFGPDLHQALAEARRSCERGMGPSHRMEGLPLDRLGHLPREETLLVPGGPWAPRRALVAGTWWLTREVELASAPARMVTFRRASDGRLAATWQLPASKTDIRAFGLERTHGCCCGRGKLSEVCPAHALWVQRARLRARFPDRHDESGIPDAELPLFPASDGRACDKAQVVATVRAAAGLLGLPAQSAEGLPLWGGHSLRVGGAQSLARLGLDTWAIQLLGRWGSDAVLGYIRAAPLAGSDDWAAQASTGVPTGSSSSSSSPSLSLDLESLLTRLVKELPQQPRGSAASVSIQAQIDSLAASVQSSVAALEGRVGTLTTEWEQLRNSLAAEILRLQRSPGAATGPQGAEGTSVPPLSLDVRERAAVAAAELDALVQNRDSHLVHAVAVSDGTDDALWGFARCGWQFSCATNASRVQCLPALYKELCEKCFPSLRGIRKQRLGQRGLLARASSGEVRPAGEATCEEEHPRRT